MPLVLLLTFKASVGIIKLPLRLPDVPSPHFTYILPKLSFQCQEETVLACLAAQHNVGDPQACTGLLSHPAAEWWHQWHLSAWTTSQTWHLTQPLGHRQSDNLVIHITRRYDNSAVLGIAAARADVAPHLHLLATCLQHIAHAETYRYALCTYMCI